MFSVVLATAMLGSCGGGGSGTAAPPPVGLQRVVFDDGGAFAAQRDLMTMIVEDTINLASTQLPVERVVVTIRNDATRTAPGYGLAGYATGPESVEIVLDAQFPDLEAVLPERLSYVVAHELHHTVRLRDPGPYTTLLEALVFEGMADHFAVQLLNTELAPWSDTFPPADTSVYLERARLEFDSTFDFDAWFFGINSDLPQWTIYTLGYRILDDYFVANPEEDAVTLVNAPANQFRPN
ncbi:MAG: DUF2268 domain-containing putative Zn-dependent protease [Pseudomonadota bacterium]